MLKLTSLHHIRRRQAQPPSGGCVLKLALVMVSGLYNFQPPSGGCVLKPINTNDVAIRVASAAFGRLCVETICFGKPCDELYSAAFGRLCVETLRLHLLRLHLLVSRLRAAVC